MWLHLLQALSAEVASYLGLDLGQVRIKKFADGEIYVQVQESIRGCDVFLLQPTCPTSSATVNDQLMELMVMVDACRCVSCCYLWGVVHSRLAGLSEQVVLLKPKNQLAHSENYFFALSQKNLSGSKYPKNILFGFEKRSTGFNWSLCVPSE